jgi:hypothetical protein
MKTFSFNSLFKNLMLQVDFYWINREQRSFEWFVSLLSQLEIEQAEQGGAMERQDNHTFRQFNKIIKKIMFSESGIEFCLVSDNSGTIEPPPLMAQSKKNVQYINI